MCHVTRNRRYKIKWTSALSLVLWKQTANVHVHIRMTQSTNCSTNYNCAKPCSRVRHVTPASPRTPVPSPRKRTPKATTPTTPRAVDPQTIWPGTPIRHPRPISPLPATPTRKPPASPLPPQTPTPERAPPSPHTPMAPPNTPTTPRTRPTPRTPTTPQTPEPRPPPLRYTVHVCILTNKY